MRKVINRCALLLALALLWSAPAQAQVAFDAISTLDRTDTSDPATWTHTPVGTPRGVICGMTHGVTAISHSASPVTYGGVNMTFLRRQTDTAGENGVAELWWLGSGIPTGAQTVSFNLDSATTDDIFFSCVTVTAAADTTVDASGSCSNAQNMNEANATCTFTPSTGSLARVALLVAYEGLSGPGTCAGETTTLVGSKDMGNFSSLHCRTGTLTDTAYTCTETGAADDKAISCGALEEVAGGGGGAVVKDLIGVGIIPFAR